MRDMELILAASATVVVATYPGIADGGFKSPIATGGPGDGVSPTMACSGGVNASSAGGTGDTARLATATLLAVGTAARGVVVAGRTACTSVTLTRTLVPLVSVFTLELAGTRWT